MAIDSCTMLWVGELPGDQSKRHRASARHLEAATIAAALAIISDEPVDVVISAHNLADGSGFDLLERVRQGNPRIARILVTEYSMVEAWRSSGLPAACAVISPIALPGVIQLARWLLARRPDQAAAKARPPSQSRSQSADPRRTAEPPFPA